MQIQLNVVNNALQYVEEMERLEARLLEKAIRYNEAARVFNKFHDMNMDETQIRDVQ